MKQLTFRLPPQMTIGQIKHIENALREYNSRLGSVYLINAVGDDSIRIDVPEAATMQDALNIGLVAGQALVSSVMQTSYFIN